MPHTVSIEQVGTPRDFAHRGRDPQWLLLILVLLYLMFAAWRRRTSRHLVSLFFYAAL